MAQHTCDGHRKTLECLLSDPHTGSWGQANRFLPAHPPHWLHNQFLVSFLNKYLLLAWGGGAACQDAHVEVRGELCGAVLALLRESPGSGG